MQRAQGGNFEITLVSGVLHLRVWKRPDLDSSEGARLASEMGAHIAREANLEARALVVDLRDAPPLFGPRTEEAFHQFLAPWAARSKRVALLAQGSLQLLQLQRVAKHVGGQVVAFGSYEEALRHVA